jgi:DNA modification methylase
MGTGTTGIEALLLGRTFIGFDIFQEYVDYAAKALSEVLEGAKNDEEQKSI